MHFALSAGRVGSCILNKMCELDILLILAYQKEMCELDIGGRDWEEGGERRERGGRR